MNASDKVTELLVIVGKTFKLLFITLERHSFRKVMSLIEKKRKDSNSKQKKLTNMGKGYISKKRQMTRKKVSKFDKINIT